MHIVCPNCTTSYAVNPATFGDAGRTVRCARCKEVWLARPEDLSRAEARVPAMAAKASEPDPNEDMSAWGVTEDDDASAPNVPVVESPSISADWPVDANDRTEERRLGHAGAARRGGRDAGHPAVAPCRAGPFRAVAAAVVRHATSQPADRHRGHGVAVARTGDLARRSGQADAADRDFLSGGRPRREYAGLAFKDVKVTTETVDGKSVLLIEGLIVSETRTPTALPRLRFVVRDEKGTEIYGWNAVLEQLGLNPGDKTWFRSRLASPPAEGRSIDVRFFTKRDVAGA